MSCSRATPPFALQRLWPLALLAACASPTATSTTEPPTTSSLPATPTAERASVDEGALLSELLKDLGKADAAMPQDDERELLGPTADALGLLVAFGPAIGHGPETSARWSEVQASARSALARLDDPRVVLGAQTRTFVLNDTNLDTLAAGHPAHLATDPELRVWRGLLLDLAGREDEARGWFGGLLADGVLGERMSPVLRQWRAWRAWRDGRVDEAAREQAEVVRRCLVDGQSGTGARELLVADLGLLLEAAGRNADGDEVLRTLLVRRTVTRKGETSSRPSSERPSWGSQLGEAALRARGVALDPPSTQLVALGTADVALLALQRGEDLHPDALHRLVFVARLGTGSGPWQLWFAEDAPLPLLQDKAEHALVTARLGTLIDVLQLLDVLSGTLAPYVDDVVRNLSRYAKNDNDNVAGLDAFLRDRLGCVPRAQPNLALHPVQFVEAWTGWVPRAH